MFIPLSEHKMTRMYTICLYTVGMQVDMRRCVFMHVCMYMCMHFVSINVSICVCILYSKAKCYVAYMCLLSRERLWNRCRSHAKFDSLVALHLLRSTAISFLQGFLRFVLPEL